MASITLSNGTVATLSISELVEYQSLCQASADTVAQAVVKATRKTHKVEILGQEFKVDSAEFDKAVAKPGSTTGKVISRCEAHAGKRGTVGNCQDCVRESTGNSPETPEDHSEGNSETPKPQRKQGGNRRGGKSGGQSFEQWLEIHGDEEMTERMERKIRYFLDAKQVPAKLRKEITSALDSDERMDCNQASEYIGKLYKLPKLAS
jgi:hypothetical protein